MFDFGLGSGEFLVIAIVALIVIGPKDLPRLLRTLGQYMRKIQGMAREFQNHLNEAAKEAGVDDVKKEVKGMTNFTVTADLDKHGSDIKRAMESSAPKKAPAGSNGAKPADAATPIQQIAATEPVVATKPDVSPEPVAPPKPIASTEPVAASEPGRAKPVPGKPKAKAGRKAPLRESVKP